MNNIENKMHRNSLVKPSSFSNLFNLQKKSLVDNDVSDESFKQIGKHIILDISSIKNMELLQDISGLYSMFDNICNNQQFTVLKKIHHEFQPQGITLLYLLAESHISFHSYPENAACFIDIFTCRLYNNDDVYNDIFNYIVRELDAGVCSRKLIINRSISSFGNNYSDCDENISVNGDDNGDKKCIIS